MRMCKYDTKGGGCVIRHKRLLAPSPQVVPQVGLKGLCAVERPERGRDALNACGASSEARFARVLLPFPFSPPGISLVHGHPLKHSAKSCPARAATLMSEAEDPLGPRLTLVRPAALQAGIQRFVDVVKGAPEKRAGAGAGRNASAVVQSMVVRQGQATGARCQRQGCCRCRQHAKHTKRATHSPLAYSSRSVNSATSRALTMA